MVPPRKGCRENGRMRDAGDGHFKAIRTAAGFRAPSVMTTRDAVTGQSRCPIIRAGKIRENRRDLTSIRPARAPRQGGRM
jgi:hypothetical protein